MSDSMKKILLSALAITVVGIGAAGCGGNNHKSVQEGHMAPQPTSVQADARYNDAAVIEQKDRNKYLAYEYSVSVDIAPDKLKDAHQLVVKNCLEDTQFHCTVLNSNLQAGEYGSGSVRMRLKPEGVSKMLEVVGQQGEMRQQSTYVDDLESSIMDVEKRITMLKEYRSKLEKLSKKSNQNIESLIQVTKELSTVQSDIEALEGRQAKLNERINMNILNVSFYTNQKTSFWTPIQKSLKSFGRNLSEGTSSLINFVSYVLPWLIIIIPLFFLVRAFLRRRKSKK